MIEERSSELLRLLRQPHPNGPREVYRGRSTAFWHVTHSADLPEYEPFSTEVITKLLKRGYLVEKYKGSRDIYVLSGSPTTECYSNG